MHSLVTSSKLIHEYNNNSSKESISDPKLTKYPHWSFTNTPEKVKNIKLVFQQKNKSISERKIWSSYQMSHRVSPRLKKCKILVRPLSNCRSYKHSPANRHLSRKRSEPQSTLPGNSKLYYAINNKVKRVFSASISMKRDAYKTVLYT